MLPDEQPSPEQIEIFKRMTPEQRRHKAAFLHSQYPDWTDEKVENEVRSIFLHART